MSFVKEQFWVLNIILAFLAILAILGNMITGTVPVTVWLFFFLVAFGSLNIGLYFGQDAAKADALANDLRNEE